MKGIVHSLRAAIRYRDYKPMPLTWLAAKRWVMQFDRGDRRLAQRLLDNVIYISESKTREILVQQNAALMGRLVAAGLKPKQFIYVSVHDTGSSSHVMLNLLRDAAALERMGCKFLDAHDSMRLIKTMNELGEGALIYVDDFLGTGNQFCSERDLVARIMVGRFPSLFLPPAFARRQFTRLASEASRPSRGTCTPKPSGRCTRIRHFSYERKKIGWSSSARELTKAGHWDIRVSQRWLSSIGTPRTRFRRYCEAA